MLYMYKIFIKSAHIKYQRFINTYAKICIYLHIHKSTILQKNVYTYMRTKQYVVKCIRLLAAASRRHKQKMHTLHIPIYLHEKVYILYIHIRFAITLKPLHSGGFTGRATDWLFRGVLLAASISLFGTHTKPAMTDKRRRSQAKPPLSFRSKSRNA